ncbi:hypothetical protein DSL72_002278 [Monilinia vaccinii-corymbosi]|uniref:2EXR domain-containing protein n=1 Tax=Monilinia vaccinii-corymbosi TaxID=61207 RepID=A0A8A3PC80_9HELO|nr:hypothetical protein DSL72_002278 [Monilinia vaccinii-corymbosi]
MEDASTPDNAFNSFPLFRKLHTEIRLMIWEMATNDPRIVKINICPISRCKHAMVRVRSDTVVPDRCQNHNYPYSNGNTCTGILDMLPQDIQTLGTVGSRIHDEQFGFRSEVDPPSLLLVCKESYAIASKRYKRAFPSVGAFAETYFDYERDVLSLPLDYLIRLRRTEDPLIAQSEACKIQNLSLSLASVQRLGRISDDDGKLRRSLILSKIIAVFCNVKRLTIEVEDHRRKSDEKRSLRELNMELEWFEPIEVAEALAMFKSTEAQYTDLHRGLLRESEERLRLDLDKKFLSNLMLGDLKTGVVWNVPQIQWKHLVTTTFKTKFEALKKEYELRTGFICHRIH